MKRGKFSLSHYKLLSAKMGGLIPLSWYEALPGDTIQMSTSALVRCAPLVTPPMHPVHVRLHHWFVPNRIIWDNWENFITGGSDGMDTSAHPYVDFASAPAESSLADYMGVPTATLSSLHVSALPFRAYALIFNEWYRDQDLVTALALSKGDGADSTTSLALANCAWEKDYYTSSRPWEQKGPTVTLPIAGSAPVTGLGVLAASGAGASSLSGVGTTASGDWTSQPSLHLSDNAPLMRMQAAGQPSTSNRPQVFADLSAATGVDINQVRLAFALQRFEEARARYGSRYTEYLRYLGVRSSDARLQRPEYLGGGRQTIQFSEVLQTSESGTTPIGDLAGHGISALRSNRFRRFFEEHGIVMTLMSVRPRTIYTQPVQRGFLRGLAVNGMTGTKEDYWQRELQHIGQQEVNGMEVDVSTGDVSFGFQDRYDEYRRLESSVSGAFRSTLDTWHFARSFGSAPALNSTFVQCVPTTRTFADTTADNLYVMAQHSVQARRLLSQVGTSMTF